jgi:hypothetical protein
VVSGSCDHTLRIWDLKYGKESVAFTVDAHVEACLAASDNRTIIVGDSFGRVHILQLVEADESKLLPSEFKIQLLIREQRSTDKPNKPVMSPPTREQVFISYSHKDHELLERLQIVLKPLLRKKLIVWGDTNIKAGAKWKVEIQDALAAAKVAVLLVSPTFLGSDFIADNELPPLLNAVEEEGVTILWVCLSSCLHDETEIGSYQAAHDISKPLNSLALAEQDRVLTDVRRKLKAAAIP